MSLPPGFLDELRSRTTLSQVVGRKVIWDTRKSNQAKGDMWGPCPFHQEKTASFHVDDRKGFYHCFGCNVSGDAISFLRETENLSFMEAVESLARDAGLAMPARDPQAQARTDHRTELATVMEDAVRFYRLQLATAAAAGARSYLEGRGLRDRELERFEIGYAPDARQGIWRHLTEKGIAPNLIIDAGLAAKPEDGGAPYDRFRGRIMFPIRDARGRCIAFGGRSMAPDARAKYLNSPETALFDKGRNLYNHGPARDAVGKGAPLVVTEGYMDVIAMVEAGFGATVAPLGTAVTEEQLRLIWRLSPEPIVALDGDGAGLRAALRIIDLALPMLSAGQGLRFCILPEGQDPDDLIRAHGAKAMRELLDQAMPMVQLLWRRETEGKVFDSPERKAALDRALAEAIGRISDPAIRRHYDNEIKQLKWELFRTRVRRTKAAGPSAPIRGQRFTPPPMPAETTRSSRLAMAKAGVEEELRESVILATLLRTPAVLARFEAVIGRLRMVNPHHERLREAILRSSGGDPAQIEARVEAHIGAEALETLFAQPHLALSHAMRMPGNEEMAVLCLTEELAKLEAARGLDLEIREATEDIDAGADERLGWRLAQAREAKNRADRPDNEDATEFDTGPNGAKMDRTERDTLDALIRDIVFSRPRR